MKKNYLIILGILALVLAIAFVRPPLPKDKVTGEATIGGPFTLVNVDGKTVHDTDFRGKYELVFFGFTSCPMICPTTLTLYGNLLTKLGKDAGQIAPIFITVDPARDTAPKMKSYLSHFDPRIIGLTGTQAQIDAALAAFHAYAKEIVLNDQTGDYTMDHSAFTYFLDKEGKFITQFAPDATADVMATEIKTQIAR